MQERRRIKEAQEEASKRRPYSPAQEMARRCVRACVRACVRNDDVASLTMCDVQ